MTSYPPVAPRPVPGSFGYRAEVDGLRALAVIAVMMFHAGLSFPGGYVGVDVFFVISGFLISSLILRDLELGRFSMRDFWERRIRRIFPALLVMVIGCLALGMLMLPYHYSEIGLSVIPQTLGAANFYFWRTTGYFSAPEDTKPLLHTWSLAVEEQFYLFLPLLFVWLFRFPEKRRRKLLAGSVAGLSVVSLLLAIILLPHKPAAVFYLLPMRAWELLAGSAIAVAGPCLIPVSRAVRELTAWIGIGLIVMAIIFYDKALPFPGCTAILPVLGTVLFILGNSPRAGLDSRLTSIGALFALKPIVFIGLISYSLYLWHWPVLVFGRYWNLVTPTPLWFKLVLLAVMTGLAVISWKFVEVPFREKKVLASRAGLFRFAFGSVALLLAAGASIALSGGFPKRYSEIVILNSLAAEEIPQIAPGSPFGDVKSGVSPEIFLWGDSHARCSAIALEAFCREQGISAIFESSDYMSAGEVAGYAEKHRIPNVIIGGYWYAWYSKHRHDAISPEETLVRMITRLDEIGCKVWFMNDVPDVDAHASRALGRDAIFGPRENWWKRSVTDHMKRNAGPLRLASLGLPAVFIDPAPAMLDASGKGYVVDEAGVSIYYDDDHLTRKASMKYYFPLFRDSLARTLRKTLEPRSDGVGPH